VNFHDFVTWGFQGIVTGAIVFGVAEIKGLRSSIESLNQQIAKTIEKTAWHEKELDKHEDRIHRLETRGGK
jgi:hypothetical protein